MPASSVHPSVSAAELVRHFGQWQDQAAREPVVVTHHGRSRVMLVSADHYQELIESVADTNDVPASTVERTEVIQQLMDHVAEGFVAFRADLTVTVINAAACAYLKVARESVVHRTLEQRLPGIEDTLGHVHLVRAIQSGSSSTFEMPSYTYAGRRLLFQTFPLDDGSACLFRDITDDLEARAHAGTKSAAMAAMAAHAGIACARLTVRGTLTMVDTCFAEMVGFTPEGLARSRLVDVLATRYRAAAMDAVEAVLEGGAASAIDVALLTRSGVEREVRIGLAPLRGPDGPNGAVVIMTHRFKSNPA